MLRRLGIFLSFENGEALLNHAGMIDDVRVRVKGRHTCAYSYNDGIKVTLALGGVTCISYVAYDTIFFYVSGLTASKR